ncbi:hypothetical protein DACRYDRAFT_22560 [Dacryopinax primogenitus]|uniref:Uncharacterized protein n=1 Tax=Dacryopinax primogenitus (strain DJM 731) TaxID=1858805 RepID=M5FY10_DACPD|nr:uncharacterized protein DACRYDRAFT_22560 [Dacryopinax primogenitus]EJU01419.1 hypothetical protein DACRYDRAFT_22560 [Dacryopinax primogenitus]
MFPGALLALLAGLAAANPIPRTACTYTAIEPIFYGSSEVVEVGLRLFDAGDDSSVCTPLSDLITGPVYLYRPGDPSFEPLKVGYWNGLNSSDPANTIFAPDVNPKGYGYQVKIVPDSHSPTHEVVTSGTFPIVSQDWFDQSYDSVWILTPDPVDDNTKWDAKGQQLLVWQYTKFDTFDVLLYKSTDVTWGPLTLAHVTNAEPLQGQSEYTVSEFYFEYPGKLPEGSDFIVVLQTSAQNKSEVIALTGLIQIVDYPVTTNTYAYTYTPVRTITGEATPG